jgi:hypothetical protein
MRHHCICDSQQAVQLDHRWLDASRIPDALAKSNPLTEFQFIRQLGRIYDLFDNYPLHAVSSQPFRDRRRSLDESVRDAMEKFRAEGALALTNDDGQTYLIHATPLGRMLANHGTLRLVILNACEGAKGGQRDLFSSTAAALGQRGIPAVLAMQYEISDRAAIELTSAFYESLADGLPVDAALAEARTSISLGMTNSLEWGTPVLYLRAQDGVLFEMIEQSTPVPEPIPGSLKPTLGSHEVPPSVSPAQLAPSPQKTKEDWQNEGYTLERQGRYEEALAAYEQAIQLDPQCDHWNYYLKAKLLQELERYEEALAAYEQAIQLNPQYAPLYALEAVMFWKLGRYKEVVAASERVIQLDSQDADAYYVKGTALQELGRTAEAEQAFQKARELGHS